MRSTSNLEAAANEMVQTMPVPIRMAGFTSDTYTLQKNGWQISCQAFLAHAIDATELRLAMKHEGVKQYAYALLTLDYRILFNSAATVIDYIAKMGFDICYMAPHIQFQVHPIRAIGINENWHAIDATPSYETFDLASFVPFRKVKADVTNLYIPTQSIEECLDHLLKLQDPKQKEIREKRRMEAAREGMRLISEKPTLHDDDGIRAQLIAV